MGAGVPVQEGTAECLWPRGQQAPWPLATLAPQGRSRGFLLALFLCGRKSTGLKGPLCPLIPEPLLSPQPASTLGRGQRSCPTGQVRRPGWQVCGGGPSPGHSPKPTTLSHPPLLSAGRDLAGPPAGQMDRHLLCGWMAKSGSSGLAPLPGQARVPGCWTCPGVPGARCCLPPGAVPSRAALLLTACWGWSPAPLPPRLSSPPQLINLN